MYRRMRASIPSCIKSAVAQPNNRASLRLNQSWSSRGRWIHASASAQIRNLGPFIVKGGFDAARAARICFRITVNGSGLSVRLLPDTLIDKLRIALDYPQHLSGHVAGLVIRRD